jgi:hypothetical protein
MRSPKRWWTDRQWEAVEIIEQPAKPRLRNVWHARQEAAERAAAEQARTRE